MYNVTFPHLSNSPIDRNEDDFRFPEIAFGIRVLSLREHKLLPV